MPKKFIDETGNRYGRLVVLRRDDSVKSGKARWICQCDCGKQVSVLGTSLRRENGTKSCGCITADRLRKYAKESVIDETGHRYGKLLVLYRAPINHEIASNSAQWVCRCDCGKECIVEGRNLRNGRTNSCGCSTYDFIAEKHRGKLLAEDLTGRRFGRWTVIERDLERIGNNAYWICKCDCGSQKSIQGSHLLLGKSSSCGCLTAELSSSRKTRDLTGQIFGKLTVMERADKPNPTDSHVYWRCKCECGNEKIVRGESLIIGDTRSCGCSTESQGVQAIKTILFEANIPYIMEYSIHINDKYPYRFDFLVDNQYVIEFDGKQHFESIDFFGGGENLAETHIRDLRKNHYCFANNIPIIRIPFDCDIDSLTLQDLCPESSQFLLTEENEAVYYNPRYKGEV